MPPEKVSFQLEKTTGSKAEYITNGQLMTSFSALLCTKKVSKAIIKEN
jgi:hypothetical protein